MKVNPILIIEKDLHGQQDLVEILAAYGYPVIVCSNVAIAMEISKEKQISLIILNVEAANVDLMDNLFKLQNLQPGVAILTLTSHQAIERATFAVQAGAVDYLVKPFMPDNLLNLVKRHLILPGAQEQMLIAESKAMRTALNLACKVAKSNVKVLLNGESGAGKSSLAHYIHAASMVRSGPLLSVDCAATNQELLEAVLFGYRRKNSAGSLEEFPGKLEAAKDGTLILDHIGALSLDVQDKLVTILKEKVLRTENREKIIPLKTRIIAITNHNLADLVKAKQFNEGLYFMLSVFPIKLPALSERKEDILPLANKFLAEYAQENNAQLLQLAADAEAYVIKKKWAGNIQELKATLRLLTHSLQNTHIITAKDLAVIEFNELTMVASKAMASVNKAVRRA